MPAICAPESRVLIVPGLAMPFYPARPASGVPLASREQAIAQVERELDSGRVVQRKRNGDRVCLGVASGRVVVQSRHGSWLHQRVANAGLFLAMGDGTCLDGEIMPGGLFHPFECLAWGGASLMRAPTSERERAARLACAHLGLPWIFSLGNIATFVGALRRNLPAVEGVVSKAEAPYPVGRSATSDTPMWRKLKWLS